MLAPASSEAIEYRAEAYLGLNRLDDAKQAYMHLFVHDRSASNVLMKAMKAWVGKHRARPAGVDPSSSKRSTPGCASAIRSHVCRQSRPQLAGLEVTP